MLSLAKAAAVNKQNTGEEETKGRSARVAPNLMRLPEARSITCGLWSVIDRTETLPIATTNQAGLRWPVLRMKRTEDGIEWRLVEGGLDSLHSCPMKYLSASSLTTCYIFLFKYCVG